MCFKVQSATTKSKEDQKKSKKTTEKKKQIADKTIGSSSCFCFSIRYLNLRPMSSLSSSLRGDLKNPNAPANIIDISSAWLVLSHGTFLSAALAASALSLTLYVLFFVVSPLKRLPSKVLDLAIGWNIVSFAISAWTVFAISKTWIAARKITNKIFDDFGFSFLMIVTIFIGAVNLWFMVLVIQVKRQLNKQTCSH